MREHVNDPYVQRAKEEGWRSRAAFKLIEIDAKDRLIAPGATIVDLGAAPGGWSQVVARRFQEHSAKSGKTANSISGRIVALDLLEMAPLPGVEFLQGDFREEATLAELERILENARVDLVLSDMAPNISGIGLSDQARVMHLAELALEFAERWLQPEGAFLVKVFQGREYDEFVRRLRASFSTVATRKPEASRGRSAEIYLLGKCLKNREA